MQLNEEDKNIVISKISENEFLGEELSSFTDNFSKSKSFIFGMGSGKQLEKILYYNNYEALLDPEQKYIYFNKRKTRGSFKVTSVHYGRTMEIKL